MSSPQLQIGLRVSWKLCRNLCSRRWLRSNLSLVINLIPLGLWQLKVEFEDGLLNFKIVFLQAQEVLEFLTFKSKLFRSMTVDGKKKIIKKLCLPLKRGILSLVLVLYVELHARNFLDILKLSDCNRTWTHNHLVCKRTLNHLAKLRGCLRTKWSWVGCGFESRWSYLTFRYRICFEQQVPYHSGNHKV